MPQRGSGLDCTESGDYLGERKTGRDRDQRRRERSWGKGERERERRGRREGREIGTREDPGMERE